MKVASKRPKATKQPVYVTTEKYEMWYSKPLYLGEINRRGRYWYTEDNLRFVSSRDALDHLIHLYEKTGQITTSKPRQIREKVSRKKSGEESGEGKGGEIPRELPVTSKVQLTPEPKQHKVSSGSSTQSTTPKRAGATARSAEVTMDFSDPFIQELISYIRSEIVPTKKVAAGKESRKEH